MILVSACLAGFKCRYDGSSKEDDIIIKLVKEGKAIPICPEILSGLSTPRIPFEIKDNKVINKNGEDYTEIFNRGALMTLELCRKFNCDKAILKSKSPTCGCGSIYDGTFTGNLIDGYGITAKVLKDNGIEVISSDDLERIKSLINGV